MSDTVGSAIDKLFTVISKLWLKQDALYEVRRMSFEQFKEKYSTEEGLKTIYDLFKAATDLNTQRAQLIAEVDATLIAMIEKAVKGEELDNGKFLQNQHKTY